jgi:transcription initiation factor IIF auxiliary subunit
MTIDLFTTEKGGKNTINHDLNFAKTRYEAKHQITFKNPSAALINILRETGPVGDENGGSKKASGSRKEGGVRAGAVKKSVVDMEKLAEGLVKLGEDDLLHVVQLIHDNKSDETYTKNDVERESPRVIPFPSIPTKIPNLFFLTIIRGRIPC